MKKLVMYTAIFCFLFSGTAVAQGLDPILLQPNFFNKSLENSVSVDLKTAIEFRNNLESVFGGIQDEMAGQEAVNINDALGVIDILRAEASSEFPDV